MRSRRTLGILALVMTILYGVIAHLSWQFDVGVPGTDRPLLLVVGLLSAAFVAYCLAIAVVFRNPKIPGGLRLIVGSAIVFRILMVFSLPIQEVDLYRYLWDGAVSSTGVSPFAYSPEQVQAAKAAASAQSDTFGSLPPPPTPPDLARLVTMLDQEPALAETLDRVHFPELPTVYPPVSQVVFAAAHHTTPAQSPLLHRVWILKAWLVAFDLGTLLGIISLLRLCHHPVQWCVMYAWCPLVMKEIANSGHLDSIAVFFTTLAIYMAANALRKYSSGSLSELFRQSRLLLAALGMALAIGAKLYPVVLAPLMLFVLIRQMGWRSSIVPSVALAAVTAAVLWPMLPHRDGNAAESRVAAVASNPSSAEVPHETAGRSNDPSLGVQAFLKQWEINDFLFLIVIENLKPTDQLPPGEIAWFSIAPQSFRQWAVQSAASLGNIDPQRAPFLIARAITAILFLIIAIALARRASRTSSPGAFCEAAFLTIAWFWLLCPTQNPWYWVWAMPLLPFARTRAWIAVSGLVLIYYLRFWFQYQYPETPVAGTPYNGIYFFDLVVTWIEFAPWFALLALASLRRYLLTAYLPGLAKNIRR